MKKNSYIKIIILIFKLLVIFFISKFIYNLIIYNKLSFISKIFLNYKLLIPALILFLLIHFVRLFRIYILLLERKIKFRDLILLYLSTTVVNNILPYKTGEIYKAIAYGEKLNSITDGILIVWIDRFFDTLMICLIILLFILNGNISGIVMIMYLFVLFSIFIYVSFKNTYLYLNKLLLTKGRTKRSVFYLNLVDKANDLYIKANKLIRGRGVILLGLSLLIWSLEYLFISIIMKCLNTPFKFIDFINYLNQSFFTSNLTNNFSNIVIFSVVLLFICFIIASFIKFIRSICRERD